MTTFIGHAATGAAIYLSRNRLNEPQVRWALPLLIFLAIAPDFDYFLLWFFKISFKPRISHSLAFCFGISILAWLLTHKLRQNDSQPPTLAMLMLAANSHLILDLLVGAHTLPIFWPFVSKGVMLPIGVLPGAIHIVNFPNYYFWRNLFIECGILFPVLGLLVAWFRTASIRLIQPKLLVLEVLWVACLLWSLGLQR
jgi:hypothetical protein